MQMKRQILFFFLWGTLIFFSCQHPLSPSAAEESIRPTLDSIITNCYQIDTLLCLERQCVNEGYRRGEMLVKYTLGKRYRESAEFEMAITTHQEALYLAEELCDTIEIINTLNQVATNYRRIGSLDEASEALYRALSLYEHFQHKEDKRAKRYMVSVLNGIGNVQDELGNREDAMYFFRRALQAEIETGNVLGQAINYSNIGSILMKEEHLDSAKQYCRLSMEANKQVHSKVGIALCHIQFGEIYEQEHLLQQALAEYKAGYDLLLHNKDRWHWFICCMSVARIYLEQGRLPEAARYIEEGFREADRMKSLRSLCDAYYLKSEYEEKCGRYDEAQRFFKLAVAYSDSISNEKNMNLMQNLRVNFEREKAQQSALVMQTAQENQRQFYLIVILVLVTVAISVVLFLLGLHLRSRRRYIDELEQKNKELLKMHHRLEKSEQMKNLFIQNISHELRTPLNAISGFSQLMASADQLGEEERRLCSSSILRNIELLTKLVNDILDLSAMETGQIEIRTSGMSAQELLRNVAAQMAAQIPQDVELKLDLPDEPLCFASDEKRLNQILINLLSNACKNTTEGCITMSASARENGIVCFAVSDTGCGIPTEKAEVIFERFEKLDRYKQGSGIGLSICRIIAEALGGKIYLDTSYHGGARFVVEIPLKE